jgi:hypothetical protein
VAKATPRPNWGCWPPLNFYLFIFSKLGMRAFWDKKVKMIELQKFESLGGGALQKLKSIVLRLPRIFLESFQM